MTNREQHTDIVIKDELTQAEEVLLIVVVLADKGKPVTLANAQEQLAEALATRPELWTLTATRLAELWPPVEQS